MFFFTASTHRYELLKNALKGEKNRKLVIPKRINTTRWSCRADAVEALRTGYKEIRECIQILSNDTDENTKTRATAKGLYDKMNTLEIAMYTVFWHDILERVNQTSKFLQNSQIDLNTAVFSLTSLKEFIEEKRQSVSDYEEKAKEVSGLKEFSAPRQRKQSVKLAPLDYGHSEEATFSQSEGFIVKCIIPALDQFIHSLDERLKAYAYISNLFFHHFDKLSVEDIKNSADTLYIEYSNDVDNNLSNELVQFAFLSKPI